MGSNQATYTQLQSDIATAQSKVDSLSSDVVALQTAKNTATGDDLTSINSQITAKEAELSTARANLASLQTQSNQLVSTWQSTGAAVSVGNSETGLTRQITNVAAGTLDTDAVNVAQLKALSAQVSQSVEAITLDAGKNINIDSGNNINLNDKITLNNENDATNQVTVDGTTSTISAGTDANEVTINGGNATITAGTGANQVTVDGSKGQVVIGDATSGIVMGNQSVTTTNGSTESGQYITGLDNTTWDSNNYVADRAATEGQLAQIAGNISDINTSIGEINNAKRTFVSDTGEQISLGKDDTLNLKGGADTSSLTEGNIGVVNNEAGNGFDIKLSSKLSGLDSVETKSLTASNKITVGSGTTTTSITGDTVTTSSVVTGNTTINNSGLTIANSSDSSKSIAVTSDNVSMGGNQIHNVAAGTAATDAVNVSQLNNVVTNIGNGMGEMSNRINRLDDRVDRVGAGAAALAALHPLDFDPDSRWEVAAGVGNYRGASAVAVGAFYRPNNDTMFSIGSSYGGGENMVNAAVTWRIGEGSSNTYSSKKAMANEIDSLKSVVSQQNDKLEAQNQKIEELMAAVAELTKNK